MDSSKIMVMDKGQVAEFDTPSNLLDPNRETKSLFAALVENWDDETS
jgi:ABC-type multidrug transport system fused ATPase/permease subunit